MPLRAPLLTKGPPGPLRGSRPGVDLKMHVPRLQLAIRKSRSLRFAELWSPCSSPLPASHAETHLLSHCHRAPTACWKTPVHRARWGCEAPAHAQHLTQGPEGDRAQMFLQCSLLSHLWGSAPATGCCPHCVASYSLHGWCHLLQEACQDLSLMAGSLTAFSVSTASLRSAFSWRVFITHCLPFSLGWELLGGETASG